MLISTVLYGSGGGRPLSMHLLRPQPAPSRPAPALLFVHGGAFRHGSKDAGVGRLFTFARRGYVCASVEYRLSGEATWPAQIEDCKCAVRYLRAHAAELGLDPDRIGAWGPSAGGHLVAMLGLAPDRPELEGSGGWAEHSSRVQAVCDWFGPSDLLTMIEQPSTIDRSGSDYPESWLLGGRVQDQPERARSASPIGYVSGREPPFLIAHGDQDTVVPYQQSQLLYEVLGSADVTLQTVRGAGHGGPQFDHPAVLDAVAAFFDRHLGPAPWSEPADARPRAVGPPPTIATAASRGWGDPESAPPLTSYRTFESAAAGGAVGYALYLPPGYEAEPARRYPTIYWLHGRGGDPRRGGTFVRMLDEAIRAGIAPPAIAVLPTGGPSGWYCDWAGGEWPVESVIVRELIPHVDATYRTIAAREARLIEGQSMGGFGSAHLGFKYPRLFGGVSISAGALIDFAAAPDGRPDARRLATLESVWGGDPERFRADDPATLARANADQIRGRQRVRIFCGDQDRLLAQNARFHELLDELDIEHEYEVVPGAEHSYDSKLERLGIEHFAFFARALGERAGASA
ncbi:MAG TPA: alpha/beta hydrolase-fold protein [Chloroflexota bacterium]